MRRHGAVELLLVLPDGSKSLVPAAWTDADPPAVDALASAVTLGSLSDLLQACDLVADLAERRGVEGGQAGREAPSQGGFPSARPPQACSPPRPRPHRDRAARGRGGRGGRAGARGGGGG